MTNAELSKALKEESTAEQLEKEKGDLVRHKQEGKIIISVSMKNDVPGTLLDIEQYLNDVIAMEVWKKYKCSLRVHL